MTKNCFMGLMLAMMFLFMANVRADLTSVPDPVVDRILGSAYAEYTISEKITADEGVSKHVDLTWTVSQELTELGVVSDGHAIRYNPPRVLAYLDINGLDWDYFTITTLGSFGLPDLSVFTSSHGTLYGGLDNLFVNNGNDDRYMDFVLQPADVGTYGFVITFYKQSTTPEPATLAILGLGLAGVGLTVRRRK